MFEFFSPSGSHTIFWCIRAKQKRSIARPLCDSRASCQKKLSCSHAVYALRAVIDYYVSGLSTVNVALLDLSKAFDRVKHDILFIKLMKLNILPTVLKLLMVWYKCSIVFVRWGVHSSFTFPLLTSDVRQGGVLSPILFCVYVDGLIHRLEITKLGCWIGDCYIGCILYADDLILMSPSVCQLQKMINVCVEEATKINMSFNAKKCAVLRFGNRYSSPCTAVKLEALRLILSPMQNIWVSCYTPPNSLLLICIT